MRQFSKTTSLTKRGKNRTVHVSDYDNGAELVKMLENTPLGANFQGHRDYMARWDSSFTACPSAEEAKKRVKYGWSCDGVEKLKKQMQVHESKVGLDKMMTTFTSVQGFMPIVPNALMGLPNSMLDIKRLPRKNRVIHIVYDATFSAYVETDDMIEVGLKVLEEVMNLESQGFKVRLTAWQDYGSNDSDEGPDYYTLTMKVKDEGMPLDAKRMAYPLFHPSFFRGLGFAWYERQQYAEHYDGLGQPMGTYLSQSEIDTLCKDVYGDKAVMINGMRMIRMTEKEREEYLTKRLSEKAI